MSPDSQTDTYSAVTVFVDNWRWADVPFYIRSGKRLPKRVTDIAIQFNAAPHSPFSTNGEEPLPTYCPDRGRFELIPEDARERLMAAHLRMTGRVWSLRMSPSS